MASKDLSMDMIDSIEDVCEGFTLMERFGVSTESCQSIDDMKERLRLHYQKDTGQGPHFHTVRDVISSVRESDLQRRQELDTVLQDIKKTLVSLDHNITQHLLSEESIKASIEEDFERHSEELRTGECPILVTGETSSGKSSLLNLLLGKEILPHRLLSCTSTICKIRYGSNLKVRVQNEDGSWSENTWASDDDCAQHISRCVVKDDQRDDHQIDIQNIEIFIPLDFLKSGVYIIDSPGFGEHPKIDSQLIDYIANHDIFAFIYVIKSDNAGGVQEDRLQKILKFIVDKQKSSHLTSFDPNSAIFICNRWDLVPECERDLVLSDNVTKLSRCWPNLSKSQVFCMSTIKAWNTLQAGYVTEDFNALLEGIHKLLPVSLQIKLNYTYKWTEHLLSRTLHHISSYLAKTRFSAQELQARQKAADLRLHKVEKESECIMKSLDKQLDKSTRKIAIELSDYLKTSEAQAKVSCWQLQQLPHAKTDDLWTDIEAEIDSVIEKRLLNVLRSWDDKHKLFQNSQKELYFMFKKEFLLVESQLESIENMLQSDTWSLSDKNDEEINTFISLIDNINMSDGAFDFNLSTLQKIALGLAAPVLVPIAVGLLVGAPVILSFDFKKWQKRTHAQHNLEKYIDDPVSFVHNRSMKVIEKVSDLDIIYEYVDKQMEPARNHLDGMRLAIPKLVEANRLLIDSIMHDKRTKAEIKEKYLHLESCIPNLQEKLAAFCNLHIRKYDYERNDVEILPPDTVLGKPNHIYGLWTEISKGRIKDENEQVVAVSVKTFRKDVNKLHMLLEENHFRKARHPHVARLIGAFEAEKGIPGTLMEPNLVKARRELFGFKALPKLSRGRSALMERCKGILEQVGMGLEYLHYKGLVHLELSLDTIMLQANKDHVKLINITEPRKADLPVDTSTCAANDFVYLSPEVLRGGVYHSRDDLYSLALVILELWKQDRVFKRERKYTLEEYIVKQTDGVVKIDNGDDENPFCDVINGCLGKGCDVITSTVFVNDIRKITVFKDDEE